MIRPWSPSKGISSSPARVSSIRTSGAPWCSSASTRRKARWGSCSTGRPRHAVVEALPELALLADDIGAVHVGGPVQPSAVVVLADFPDPERRRVSRSSRPSGSCRRRSIPSLSASYGERVCTSASRAGARVSSTASWKKDRGSWSPRSPRTSSRVIPDGLWSAVLRRKGGPFGVLASMPPDPSRN